jgi:amidohydrolase
MEGIKVETGIGKTGVKEILRGSKPGPVIALRADMDALPIEERNDLPFKSTQKAPWQGKESSVMHACGHDAHVAILLGTAEVFSKMKDDINGTVVFIFQLAEEWGANTTPSGAFAMVADGVMDNPKVDAILGQHIYSGLPAGQFSYRYGAFLASSDNFHVTVKGKGGHGGLPWLTKDPIVTAAQMIVNLQSIVSRQVDLSEGAAAVTVALINSGNRPNIIPETASFSGTIRTLNESTRSLIQESVTKIVHKTAEAEGLTAEITIEKGYPVLFNDPNLSEKILGTLENVAGKGQLKVVPAQLGSEDFGAYTAKAPGFYWTFNAPPYTDRTPPPNHSPLFAIDEKYLKLGVEAFVKSTMALLRQGK